MNLNGCNTVLLLVAILLASGRAVLASNGLLGLPLASRGATSESSEKNDGGESERESGTESSSEGRKIRRAVTLFRLSVTPLQLDRESLELSPLSRGIPIPPAPASEHSHRFGLGTPIRI